MPSQSLKLSFYALIAVTLTFIIGIVFPGSSMLSGKIPFFALLLSMLTLSIILVYLTHKQKLEKKLKKCLYLTGGSIIGMFTSIILHNLVYALGILAFSQNFWQRTGLNDEPLFFILGVLICPLLFITGAIGAIVLFTKNKRAK